MWVVVALCVLVALTILVLSVPVDLDVRIEVHSKSAVHLRVAWLFGLVKKTFGTGVPKTQKKDAVAAGKEERGRKRKKARGGISTVRAKGSIVWQIVRVPGLWRSVVRLIARMRRCITVKRLRTDFRVDLGDPVDTALVVGGMSQVALMADVWTRHSFRVSPSFFGDAVLDGEADLAVRFYPVCTIPQVLKFMFSLSMFRVVFLLVRYRWGRDR